MPDEHEDRTLTCVYCGQAYPPGTPTYGAPVLTAHVVKCPKHPMKEAVDLLLDLVNDDMLDFGAYFRILNYLKRIGVEVA
jgi:hypothetical protein